MLRVFFHLWLCGLSGCLFFDSGTEDGSTNNLGEVDMRVDMEMCLGDESLFDGRCVAKGCGDGLLDGAEEECDGDLFSPQTSCTDPKFPIGTPSCSDDCKLDYGSCRTGFVQVSVGEDRACAISSNNEVVCWGANDTKTPDENEGFVEVAVGGRATCGRKTTNDVRCWGLDGYTIEKSDVVSNGVSGVSAGSNHECFLKTDGRVFCDGLFENQVKLGWPTVSQISSGPSFVSGLDVNGAIQFAVPNMPEGLPQPNIAAGNGYTSLIAGRDYVCAQRNQLLFCPLFGTPDEVLFIDAGPVGMCWIDLAGDTGCLEVGGKIPDFKFSSLSVGNAYACGIIAEGEDEGQLRCWGTPFPNGDPGTANQILK